MQQILKQEMTRRDFLIRVAGLALIVTGVTGILQKFRNFSVQSHGYGSSAYGGNKRGL